MPTDDRNVETNIYCTDHHGKECRYEKDRPKTFGSRCRLFGKSLTMGRELQSLRCKECRAIPPGQSIPEPKEP